MTQTEATEALIAAGADRNDVTVTVAHYYRYRGDMSPMDLHDLGAELGVRL